ncbi:DUF2141 domain-containing protein [Novosphingobium beihaiensis]|uniref:DUF2141 domain-containing protein n=1 Tax=Novosphingobium beihaiensis TaxID=2930389 RepID=A0ABT0BNP3_9SPHN|nr:DUF2141 domain-containing protein [Novosphingobium beihaiensis]MCJ2186593.1 DUF2141 domain-containing protein [Novosphingobium beihaiensis]
MKTRPLAALIAAFSASPAMAQPQSTFTLTVTGLHSTKGQIVACLWRDKVKFPSCEKSKTAIRRTFPVTGPTMHVTLPLPAAGRYAVTVIHDEDGNGKTKRNFIGMPLEGVGISNNPGGMPGYGKSLTDIAPGTPLTIRMKYLFG